VLKNIDDLGVEFRAVPSESIEDQKQAVTREREQEQADYLFDTAQNRKSEQVQYEEEASPAEEQAPR
jgi:hypothetical protein